MALELPENVVVSKLDELASWCRKNSLWPMPFATACCGIELMATGASKHDVARFGAEVFRFSPRQCDLMIVAGRVSRKMAPVLRQIYDQMPEPKWVISMGACASCGGVFEIDGDQLKAKQSFDFETKSSYTIRVRSTVNGAGRTYTVREVMPNANWLTTGSTTQSVTVSSESCMGTANASAASHGRGVSTVNTQARGTPNNAAVMTTSSSRTGR